MLTRSRNREICTVALVRVYRRSCMFTMVPGTTHTFISYVHIASSTEAFVFALLDFRYTTY